jgi:hypothetical protein
MLDGLDDLHGMEFWSATRFLLTTPFPRLRA